MLLTFRVSNFRSFKDEVTISLLATRLDKGHGFDVVSAADGSSIEVLPVVAVLGANASGKSNLLRAMSVMRDMVLNSASRARYEDFNPDYFLLDPECAAKPTLMELNFIIDGNRYQYGFEVARGRVTEEWLHTFPHKRTQLLFDREHGDEYQFGKNLGGQNRVIADITRPAVLFLSSAAQAGHQTLSIIYEYFYRNLILLDVADRGKMSKVTVRRLREKRGRAVLMLNQADLGILDARVQDPEIPDERLQQIRTMIAKDYEFPAEMSAQEREEHVESILAQLELSEPEIELLHNGGDGRAVALPFEEESLGTKSWLSFAAHALEALEHGATLLVDELDASLHPLLLVEALRIFQSPRTNTRGAQLIFTTHDVTLLSRSLDEYHLSRGQVWLTEKSDDGSSTLVPLSDYRPRKGEDLARGYLQGRYGGTPRLTRRAPQRAVAGQNDGS